MGFGKGKTITSDQNQGGYKRGLSSNELENYFMETTVHGFRYLVDGRTPAERLAWMFVIFSGFLYAGYLIHSNLNDWEKNPVMTTIASTSTPVDSVQFPTVTICLGEMAEPDRWSVIEEILNEVNFECFEEEDQSCEATEGVRALFPELLQGTFGNIVSFVNGILSSKSYEEIFEELEIQMAKDTDGENTQTEMVILQDIAKQAMEDPFVSSIARKLTIKSLRTQLAKLKYYDSYNKDFSGVIPGVLNKLIRPQVEEVNGTVDDIQRCKEAPPCLEELKQWQIIFIAAFKTFQFINFGGIGTYLSHFAYLLGPSFREVVNYPSKPEKFQLSALEDRYHQFFANAYKSLWGKDDNDKPLTTILDIPALFGYFTEEESLIFGAFGQLPWVVQPYYTLSLSKVCSREEFQAYTAAWISYIYGKEKYLAKKPCDSSQAQVSPCCGRWMANNTQDEIDQLMKMMRFAFPQGKGHRNGTHLRQMFNELKFMGNVTMKKTDERGRFVNQLIANCQGQIDCNLFEPMFTSNGICYSYNAKSASQIFRESQGMKAFSHIYNVQPNLNVVNAEGDGDRFGFTFHLDANTRTRPNFDFHNGEGFRRVDRKSTFTIGISNSDTPFNMKRNTFIAEPGRHTIIKVMPTELTSSDDLKSLEVSRRKCKFKNEVDDLRLFKEYTQAGCQFECMWNYSLSVCGCIPWNFPRLDDSHVCDMFGNMCFQDRMKDLDQLKTCNCWSDCQAVSFTYSESSTIISPKQACSKGFINQYIYQKYMTSWFPLRYRSLEDQFLGKSTNQGKLLEDQEEAAELCLQSLEHDIARVTVKLGTPVLTTSAKARKTTFAEQLATLGGTVGLFTGMSFLSAFEILFWLKRLLFRGIGGRKRKVVASERG